MSLLPHSVDGEIDVQQESFSWSHSQERVESESQQSSPYRQALISPVLAGGSLWAPVAVCELSFPLPPAVSSCSIPSSHFHLVSVKTLLLICLSIILWTPTCASH